MDKALGIFGKIMFHKYKREKKKKKALKFDVLKEQKKRPVWL